MKNKMKNEEMAKGRQTSGINDIPVQGTKLNGDGHNQREIYLSFYPPVFTRFGLKAVNIIVEYIGKSPPGRSRSPGTQTSPDPDHPNDALNGIKTIYNLNNQIFNTKK